MNTELSFRWATADDVGLILYFIKEIADYEKLLSEVVATEETLHEWIFVKEKVEVIFPILDGKEIGFALFFHNFSTFVGRGGLYIEDIYLQPEYRGKGYGKAIFKELTSIATNRGCGRIELICLDWNKSSIDFYKSLGAIAMDGWTVYRISDDKFKAIVES